MTEFEHLLDAHREVIERYIFCRMANTSDAEDVIQNTYLAAFRNFASLKDHAAFRYWLLSIAKNECRMFWRRKYRTDTVPLDAIGEISVSIRERETVLGDIISGLPDMMREIFTLYYIREMSQAEISAHLGIPVGTVKSRLHSVRERIRSECPPHIKKMYERGTDMKNTDKLAEITQFFPVDLPKIDIKRIDAPFFEVRYTGTVYPANGSTLYAGTYSYPSRKLFLAERCRNVLPCEINGAHGITIEQDIYSAARNEYKENAQTYYVQVTDDYIRYLGKRYIGADGIEVLYTFLDDGYAKIVNAEDPTRGNRILIRENPVQTDSGSIILPQENIRYTRGIHNVKIGGETHEAVCVITLHSFWGITEEYITKAGCPILTRVYEPTDESDLGGLDTILVNGQKYAHTEDRIYK